MKEFFSKVLDFLKGVFMSKKTNTTKVELKGADYWNNKFEKNTVIYSGRTPKLKENEGYVSLQQELDVKTFIHPNDALLKRYLSDNNLIVTKSISHKLDEDATAAKVHNHLVRGKLRDKKLALVYTSDSDQFKSYEYWQFPFETLASRKGDCEDGAILMAALLINAGIPSYRVKVACGNVSNRHLIEGSPSFEEVPFGKWSHSELSEGGHCYCLYLASDDEWRILDWCYFEDTKTSMLKKPLAKNGGYEKCYLDTWWTFNNEYSWSPKELEIDGTESDQLFLIK